MSESPSACACPSLPLSSTPLTLPIRLTATVPPSTSTAIHPTDPSLPSLSSATSTYTGPGRCVFTLAYQSFYVTEVDKWKRKFPGIKEKKLEGKVRRGWEKVRFAFFSFSVSSALPAASG